MPETATLHPIITTIPFMWETPLFLHFFSPSLQKFFGVQAPSPTLQLWLYIASFKTVSVSNTTQVLLTLLNCVHLFFLEFGRVSLFILYTLPCYQFLYSDVACIVIVRRIYWLGLKELKKTLYATNKAIIIAVIRGKKGGEGVHQ